MRARIAKLWAAAICVSLGSVDCSQHDLPPQETMADARLSVHPPTSWGSFGYDLSNTQVSPLETTLAVDNVSRLNERWRLNMPSGASSTPVVADGTVYFGGWNGHAYAVDAHSGEIVWDRLLTGRLIRSTPLIQGDRLYIAAGYNLLALDRHSGATLFETRLDDHFETLVDASPKWIDDMILVGVSHSENSNIKADYTAIGALVALDANSGKELWRVRTTGAEPGICQGGAGVSVWSSVALDPQLGLAFVGTGQSFEEPASTCNDSLLAIHYARDYQGERIAWKATFTEHDVYAAGLSSFGPDADIGASPNLFQAHGRALVGVGDKGGSYRVFDRTSGALVWRKDLARGESTGAGGVMVTAAVSAETLYVASNVFVNGSFVFTGQHDPADTGMLYALDAASGDERWSLPLKAPMVGSFAIANGVIYHPIIDGTLYARELRSGRELWSVTLPTSLGSGPSIVDGQLYLSGGMVFSGAQPERNGLVVAFGLEAGPAVERQAPPDSIPPQLTAAECKTKLNPELIKTPECGDCLCACNPTAAGYCDECWAIAPCTSLFCAFARAGDEMRSCIADACGQKLLPTYLFDRAVDAGPCTVSCAFACGF